MRLCLIFITFFTLFTTQRTTDKKAILSIDKTVFVHFLQDLDTDKLKIDFIITGAFGGYGSSVQVKPNVLDYEIPTSHEGKPAKSIKLTVYSPHYRTKVFDFPILEDRKANIEFELQPSKTVPFSGKVLLPNQSNREKLRVQVSYTADWQCVFYKLPDCMLAITPMAVADLDKDGGFTVNLPDFAGDQVIASFGNSGHFSFSLLNKDGDKLRSYLKIKDKSKDSGRIAATTSYPNETVFISEIEK